MFLLQAGGVRPLNSSISSCFGTRWFPPLSFSLTQAVSAQEAKYSPPMIEQHISNCHLPGEVHWVHFYDTFLLSFSAEIQDCYNRTLNISGNAVDSLTSEITLIIGILGNLLMLDIKVFSWMNSIHHPTIFTASLNVNRSETLMCLYAAPLNAVQILTSAPFYKMIFVAFVHQEFCNKCAVMQTCDSEPRPCRQARLERIRLASELVDRVKCSILKRKLSPVHSLLLLCAPLNLHLPFAPRPRSGFLAPAWMQEWEVLLGDRLAPSFQEAECRTSTIRV